jgi:hypothetical protein
MMSAIQKSKVVVLQKRLIELDSSIEQIKFSVMDMSNTFEELEALFDELRPLKTERVTVEGELKELLTLIGFDVDAWLIPLTEITFE